MNDKKTNFCSSFVSNSKKQITPSRPKSESESEIETKI